MPDQKKKPADNLTYVDDPAVSETYVDGLHMIMFDGLTVRIELVVHRFDELNPPNPPSGKKITAARLVLSPEAAQRLLDGLGQVAAAIQAEQAAAKKPVSPKSMH